MQHRRLRTFPRPTVFAAVQWAYENGVALGSDGKFNPGANITRQDIRRHARALRDNVAGFTLPELYGTLYYTDNGGIASYAADAVTMLQQAGIISGNPDGSFAPTAFATRAQAAKMIAVLLKLMIL
jgi:hypothetical protein